MEKLEDYVMEGYGFEVGFLDSLNLNDFDLPGMDEIAMDVWGSGQFPRLGIMKLAAQFNQDDLLKKDDGTLDPMKMGLAQGVIGGFLRKQTNPYIKNFGIGMVKGAASSFEQYAIQENLFGLAGVAAEMSGIYGVDMFNGDGGYYENMIDGTGDFYMDLDSDGYGDFQELSGYNDHFPNTVEEAYEVMTD
jgi:hypothetical protein